MNTLRKATSSDWGWVWPLLKEMHASSPYAHLPVDKESAKRMYMLATSSPRFLATVCADAKHRVTGVVLGQVVTNWWGAEVAHQLAIYSGDSDELDALAGEYHAWAKDEKQVDIVALANTSGLGDDFEKMLTAHSFDSIGGVYMDVRH